MDANLIQRVFCEFWRPLFVPRKYIQSLIPVEVGQQHKLSLHIASAPLLLGGGVGYSKAGCFAPFY